MVRVLAMALALVCSVNVLATTQAEADAALNLMNIAKSGAVSERNGLDTEASDTVSAANAANSARNAAIARLQAANWTTQQIANALAQGDAHVSNGEGAKEYADYCNSDSDGAWGSGEIRKSNAEFNYWLEWWSWVITPANMAQTDYEWADTIAGTARDNYLTAQDEFSCAQSVYQAITP